MAGKILSTSSQMNNVKAITQSRAHGSCQSPRKSIFFHLGGSSEVFVKLSQCPGIPRSFKTVSLGNKLEELTNKAILFLAWSLT